jgi:hypothetical protein
VSEVGPTVRIHRVHVKADSITSFFIANPFPDGFVYWTIGTQIHFHAYGTPHGP